MVFSWVWQAAERTAGVQLNQHCCLYLVWLGPVTKSPLTYLIHWPSRVRWTFSKAVFTPECSFSQNSEICFSAASAQQMVLCFSVSHLHAATTHSKVLHFSTSALSSNATFIPEDVLFESLDSEPGMVWLAWGGDTVQLPMVYSSTNTASAIILEYSYHSSDPH